MACYDTTIRRLGNIHDYKKNQCRSRILNVLIVDDDDGARESLKELIESRGHNVTSIDEGMKCVNRCYDNKFDIIFMDYHIDDIGCKINGIDVVKLVRDCFDMNPLIYAYTGDNTARVIDNFKNNNINGAFIKPIDHTLINEFLFIVEQYNDNPSLLSRLAMKKKNFMYFNKRK